MSKLLSAYSGDNAINYDAIRSGSTRWKNEVAAMERFLRDIHPRSVIDCPFGTGRWIPQYHAMGIMTIGVDLSTGMLEQAAEKLKQLGGGASAQFHLIEGSIFELGRLKLPYAPDAIACIRFVNWVSFDDVRKVIQNLTALPAKDMILGASVVPKEASAFKRLRMRLALKATNLRLWRHPPQYVHAEEELLELLARHGWKVAGQLPTFENASRINFFYRLTRA